MISQVNEEKLFEAKFSAFKQEILGSERHGENLVDLQNLMEILEKKINDRQFVRDLVVSIHDSINKSAQQTFHLRQFFDACIDLRKRSLEKLENSQIQLAKLQKEKTEALNALQQNKVDLESGRRKGILTVEVDELQDLNINPPRRVFVKLTSSNVYFQTMTKSYSEGLLFREKFSFDILTGFERVDIQVFASYFASFLPEELIGTTQVHVSGIKDQNYKNDRMNLYDGKTYTSVGRIQLGLQYIHSKVEYLTKVIERLEQHILLQIEEIEESEKILKNLNALISPSPSPVEKPKKSSPESGKTIQHGNRKRVSGSLGDTSEPSFRPILEEDGESTDNSNLDIFPDENFTSSKYPLPDNFVLEPYAYQMVLNPHVKQILFNGSNFANVEMEQKIQIPQPLSQENSFKTENSNTKINKSDIPGIPNFSKSRDSAGVTSFLDTQSHSPSNNESDKDVIINYLQNKLNEVTRENERLNNVATELLNENQKMKSEILKTNEYKQKLVIYEKKIHALVSEIERLDKITNMTRNGLENDRNLANLNYSKQDSDLEKNMKILIDENLKLTQELQKKTKENKYWKSQVKVSNVKPETIEPKQFRDLSHKRPTQFVEPDLQYRRLNKPPKKIFPNQTSSDVTKTISVHEI